MLNAALRIVTSDNVLECFGDTFWPQLRGTTVLGTSEALNCANLCVGLLSIRADLHLASGLFTMRHMISRSHPMLARLAPHGKTLFKTRKLGAFPAETQGLFVSHGRHWFPFER
jgi:hypothetical protein